MRRKKCVYVVGTAPGIAIAVIEPRKLWRRVRFERMLRCKTRKCICDFWDWDSLLARREGGIRRRRFVVGTDEKHGTRAAAVGEKAEDASKSAGE